MTVRQDLGQASKLIAAIGVDRVLANQAPDFTGDVATIVKELLVAVLSVILVLLSTSYLFPRPRVEVTWRYQQDIVHERVLQLRAKADNLVTLNFNVSSGSALANYLIRRLRGQDIVLRAQFLPDGAVSATVDLARSTGARVQQEDVSTVAVRLDNRLHAGTHAWVRVALSSLHQGVHGVDVTPNIEVDIPGQRSWWNRLIRVDSPVEKIRFN